MDDVGGINLKNLKNLKGIINIMNMSNQEFYNKMKMLDWITPEHLNIRISNMNEYCWDSVIQKIKEFDLEKIPSRKISHIKNALSMIKSSIAIFGNKEDSGGMDDASIILCYCILKACPKYFITDIVLLNNFVSFLFSFSFKRTASRNTNISININTNKNKNKNENEIGHKNNNDNNIAKGSFCLQNIIESAKLIIDIERIYTNSPQKDFFSFFNFNIAAKNQNQNQNLTTTNLIVVGPNFTNFPNITNITNDQNFNDPELLENIRFRCNSFMKELMNSSS